LYARGVRVDVGVGLAMSYLRGGRVGVVTLLVFSQRGNGAGVMGLVGLYLRGGRVGVTALAGLYLRGGRVGGVGLAITSLRDAGVRYALNIPGLRGNGVWEGVEI
jgi:hypothetical protein